jgi:DNA-binding NarL/FixJ family response regulator
MTSGVVDQAVDHRGGDYVVGEGRRPAAAEPKPAPPAGPGLPLTGRIASRSRAKNADVHRMLAAGRFHEIAGELGLSRNTVRHFARAAYPEEILVSDCTGR